MLKKITLLFVFLMAATQASAQDAESYSIVYYDGGRFEMVERRTWEEYADHGGVFHFTETKRNRRFVELFDYSRNLKIRLNAKKSQIFIKTNGSSSFKRLYQITDSLHVGANNNGNNNGGNQNKGIVVGSWGGKVRSGPGMGYNRITSLRNGDPVTVLENAGVMMNGYPWFRISFKNGRTGYQWGGIMCGFDGPIQGLYGVCEKDRRNGSNNNSSSNSSSGGNQSGANGGGCHRQGNIKSKNDNQAITVTFINNSNEHRSAFWIDYTGQPVHYFDLNPGQRQKQQTFVGHPWMFTDGPGNCIELRNTKRGKRTVRLKRRSPGFGPE